MNDRALINLVAETDPYPSSAPLPDVYATPEVALHDLIRGPNTDTRDRIEQQRQKSVADTKRRWAPAVTAAAAFGVIAVVVGGAFVLWLTNESPPAEPATTITTVAPTTTAEVPAPPFEALQQAVEGYRAAWQAGDFSAYQALFAPNGAEIEVWHRGLPIEKVQERFVVSYGNEGAGVRCEPITDLQVKCTYTRSHQELSRISDEGTVDVTQIFTFAADGRFLFIGHEDFDLTASQDEALGAWDDWYQSTYPDLRAEVLVVWRSAGLLERPAEEFRADYLAALEEYAATLTP